MPADIYNQMGADYKVYTLTSKGNVNYYPPITYNPFFCEPDGTPTGLECYFLPTPQEQNLVKEQNIQYTGRMYRIHFVPPTQVRTGDDRCLAHDQSGNLRIGACSDDISAFWTMQPVRGADDHFRMRAAASGKANPACLYAEEGTTSLRSATCDTKGDSERFRMSESGQLQLVGLSGQRCVVAQPGQNKLKVSDCASAGAASHFTPKSPADN